MIISSDVLKKGLDIIKPAMSSKVSIPILANVLMRVEGDKLTLLGGDGEVSISTSLELIEPEEFECTADFKTLQNAVKSLPTMPIEFKLDSKLTCSYKMGSFEIPIMPAEEYPKLEDVEGEGVVISSVKDVNISKLFVANDELRPVMNGVLFDFENGYLVSSDGNKLFRSSLVNGAGSFICPPKALNSICKLPTFSVRFNNTNALFESEETKIIARLIDGRYPNYNSVIPTDNRITYTVDKDSLIDAVKRVSAMQNEASNLLKLEFTQSNLNITAEDKDFQKKALENVKCEGNEAINIGFKSNFLIQVLTGLSGDMVEVKMADSSRASLWSGDDDNVILLMPMMLND